MSPLQVQPPAGFEPQRWLSALTTIGGGYALMSDRKLAFLVDGCDTDALAGVMGQIIGQPERQDAIKATIERRQCGEAA
jgi:hypothetical protein